ncbi:hypothetical protein ADICYQ_5409 [Cyclobacterium qasimii M12-11B]|uniref:Uncharacterized protein n=1 Tax=Cyclobacterium qasimii M12-11B TaxID=641524 RepID=S7WMR0_9BACT|nr:hypothetical protein ADICYQ_5409 [Cyclobacterium qasimii M12-11B]
MFNSFDHSIDEVNLDKLEVVNNYPFEAEGPNGTGEHVNYINILKDDLIFIKSFSESAVFDRNGHLINKMDWLNAIDSKGMKYGEIPRNEVGIGASDFKVFGLNYNNRKSEIWLDILSVKDNAVERFEIDAEKSYHNFVIKLDDPEYYTFLDPIVFLSSENDFIMVSHQFSNEIYLFNAEGAHVKTVNYQPKSTPKRAKGLSGNITSNGHVDEAYQHLLEQVRFGPPVWDRVKKRYFRLSAMRIYSDTREQHSSQPEIQEVNVFLSVFDADFNLVSEVVIPELNNEFAKYFAKDGKLWVFQNFSDELGFIVVDV